MWCCKLIIRLHWNIGATENHLKLPRVTKSNLKCLLSPGATTRYLAPPEDHLEPPRTTQTFGPRATKIATRASGSAFSVLGHQRFWKKPVLISCLKKGLALSLFPSSRVTRRRLRSECTSAVGARNSAVCCLPSTCQNQFFGGALQGGVVKIVRGKSQKSLARAVTLSKLRGGGGGGGW